MTTNCLICSQELVDDPSSLAHDCGGDCLECMAKAGDPECIDMTLTIYGNQFYHEYSALVNKYLKKADEITDHFESSFDMKLSELSNLYSRDEDA